MANMTDAFKNEILDGITGVTTLFSAGMYLALFTADPTDTGSVLNEVSGGSYARVALSGKFSAASGTGGTSANAASVVFPTATADWGTVTHVGFMKAGTAGVEDMVVHSALSVGVAITTGSVFQILAGDLTVTAA